MTEKFEIYVKDYICMSLALAAAAELISRYTGYSIEEISAQLTLEANHRMAKIPPESHKDIVNSYFLGKEHHAPATLTTINLKP
ncbi:hypothetical protein [Nostoc sp. TCL26-01]|uniref:hypothetical protein n=1 Tax=Nostoc sp. TCL26-01 TaxID=2576904 RepID=UPI0015BE9565|nr:hypothetical protein [Nostoc sp. TCL26-01]QLE55655.1 hypothetical protein FD725_09080 [Nostoc sp. TCL26-01]